MCGRFSLSGPTDLYAGFFGVERLTTESLAPSYNVAPTDSVYVVAEHEGERLLGAMRWGLLPHWEPRRKTGQINARAETVATRPAFRESFRRRRCLIPADGFYEWERVGGRRVPHWIHRADGYPLALAGLWASWKDAETSEWVRSCAIVTTVAEGVISRLHDRMPVALAPEMWGAWLDRKVRDPEVALSLLRPIDSDLFMEHEVSPLVNSVRNNSPACLLPAAAGGRASTGR